MDDAGKLGCTRVRVGRTVPFDVVAASAPLIPNGNVSTAVKPPLPAFSNACSDCSGEMGISVAEVGRTSVSGPSPGGKSNSSVGEVGSGGAVLYIGSHAIAGSVNSGRNDAGPRTESPSMV